VVKPVDADNSLGVTLVRDPAAYASALPAALLHSSRALVEEYVPLGREVRCGVVVRAGELVCLPLEEYAVDTATKPVRDHDDKIRTGTDGLALVAKDAAHAWTVGPDDPVTAPVWEAARRCHVALGCRHYSLFDFRVDPGGRPVFLEASLYCSFATQSVIPVMARAAGISLPELLQIVLDEGAAGS
jgi:D-alanine-D-alanine ligase